MKTTLFIATHPRSTSTALERAFLTRTGDNDSLADTVCIHEPFGEPFYYGPERMSTRFSEAVCADMTRMYPHELRYTDVIADIDEQHNQNNKSVVVIKDMAQYIVTPRNTGRSDMVIDQRFFSGTMAESDDSNISSSSFNKNKNKKKVVILVRAPHLSVPSYYRCCIPPLSARTGFDFYDPDEAGYRELRILYDHLKKSADNDDDVPLIIDSADLCRNPRCVIQSVCDHAGIEFRESMLEWEQNSAHEQQLFKKWNGFHDDALNSRGFKATKEKQQSTLATSGETDNASKYDDTFEVDYDKWTAEWNKKFNSEQVAEIRDAVERNLEEYLYLRQFRQRF